MGIVVKKMTRKTFLSLLSVAGLAVALVSRFFLGGAHTSLSRLGSVFSDRSAGESLVSVAHADVPAPPPGVEGTEGDGGTGGDDTAGGGCSEGSADSL